MVSAVPPRSCDSEAIRITSSDSGVVFGSGRLSPAIRYSIVRSGRGASRGTQHRIDQDRSWWSCRWFP